jgi:hypothetical protein
MEAFIQMSDEKKEFCFPKFKEDVLKLLITILGSLAFVWLVYNFGKYMSKNKEYCIKHTCTHFDYMLEGGFWFMSGIGGLLVIIITVGATLEWLYEQYWLTEKDCYGDDGK